MDSFTFTANGLPSSARLVGYRGTETLCRPYRFEAGLLVLSDDDLDDAALVGERATLRMDHISEPQQWHGIICQADLIHAWAGHLLYKLCLVPALWRLSLSHHSRVWVDKSTPDILRSLLTASGLQDGTDFTLKLGEDYAPHPHVSQYKESDLAFLHRRLERDGLYYFFEHGDSGQEKLIITDSRTFHSPSRSDRVPYSPMRAGDVTANQAFDSLSSQRRAMPEAVELADYDHLNPALNVFGDNAIAGGLAQRMRLHGEGFTTPDDGKRLAGIRSQERACRALTFHASGHVHHLRAGYRFSVSEHPADRFNADYLAVELEHCANIACSDEATQRLLGLTSEPHRVNVTAIPADVQFRAERTTPIPRITGLERARIDGAADSPYAQLDEHGRYAVKLDFDESDLKDGNASTRLRMLQPHGGETEGFHFPLRKATEVMVAFSGGDPDQPVITGVVPNAHRFSPVTDTNHTQNVLVTGGNNQMVFEDVMDGQYVTLSTPSKDTVLHMGEKVEGTTQEDPGGTKAREANIGLASGGDMLIALGGMQDIWVGGRRVEYVKGNVDEDYLSLFTSVRQHQIHTVGTQQTVVVKGLAQHGYGSFEHTVEGNVLQNFKVDNTLKVGGFYNIGVGSWYTLDVAGKIKVKTRTNYELIAPAGALEYTGPRGMHVLGKLCISATSGMALEAPGGLTIYAPEMKHIDGSLTQVAAKKVENLDMKLGSHSLVVALIGAKISRTAYHNDRCGVKNSLAAYDVNKNGYRGHTVGTIISNCGTMLIS